MKRKRIVIFGANGMLGHDLRKVLEKDYDLVLTDIQDGDIRDFSFVEKFLNKNLPSIVINSAAYTDVDGCEKNQKIAMEVNAYGAGNIAKASKKISSWLIHISSDYVFDGKKNLPYKEDDPINPLSIYGKSKALAEELVRKEANNYLIIRPQWLYGKAGKNFVFTILNLSKKQKEIKVVADQFGSPTYTYELSKAIKVAIEKKLQGIFHIAANGYCSWYDFAKEILKISGITETEVIPISSDDLKRPASRPNNSKLDCSKWQKFTSFPMKSWQKALKDFILSIKQEGIFK